MDLGLTGKVALVAAASKGIGRATAWGLAAEGARVALCARNEAELEQTAKEIEKATGGQVLPMRADVSVASDIERWVAKVIETWGGVDILVNNAGGPPMGQFLDLSDEVWGRAVELNLMSTVRMCRAVIPIMKQRGGGRIINVTSVSVKQPLEDLILSNSVRAGVVGLAKTLSLQLAPFGITVNNVCPGCILTQRMQYLARSRAEREGITFEEAIKDYTRNTPLGRMGKPEEVADLIVFLASERAAYITGVSIQVDGGLVRGIY